MEIDNLKLDRFLGHTPDQTGQTKDAIYTSSNPVPKKGDDFQDKIGQANNSKEDDGALNILTGTQIISCFIQTTALPSRIEIAGNDITFYDDTYTFNNKIVGDTSRIFFTHDLNSNEGFIWEKRASTHDTYDNVLSLYALPAKKGRMNYMYFGIDGRGENANTNYMSFYINRSTEPVTQDIANGGFLITGAVDGIATQDVNFAVINNKIIGVTDDGFSVLLSGSGSGYVGVGSNFQALGAGLDIGSAGIPFDTIYVGTIVATTLSISSLSVTTLTASDSVSIGNRLHLSPKTINYGTAGDVWYYNNGSEGLRMQITGFRLQFDATIV